MIDYRYRLRIGDMRHRIVIQHATETQDNYGGTVIVWSDFATIWGAADNLSGREYFAAQQVNAEVTTRIRAWYKAGVVPKMRAVIGGQVYDIKAVLDPDGLKREMHLMCKAVV